MTNPANSQVTESDIEKAIDDYLKNAPALKQKFISAPQFPEENLMFNIFGQQQYLLISKFNLPNLPIRILRRLPLHLIKQFAIQVELDSKWYWALTHDLVKFHGSSRTLQSWQLMPAFETLMAAQFAKLGSAPINQTIDKLNRVIDDVVPEPVKDLVLNSQFVLMYVCYPVLEGLAKFAISPLVDPSGLVLSAFSDGKKSYNPGNQINSLAVLLRALEANASSLLSKPEFSADLRDVRQQIETMIPPKRKSDDGWDSVYTLRNISLHGAVGWQLRSGLITNLVCLIVLHLMDDQEIKEGLQHISMRPRFWPGLYYPPEL